MEKDPRITSSLGEAASVDPGESLRKIDVRLCGKSTVLGVWEK